VESFLFFDALSSSFAPVDISTIILAKCSTHYSPLLDSLPTNLDNTQFQHERLLGTNGGAHIVDGRLTVKTVPRAVACLQ
jgi:hypothetical protein